MKFINFCLFFVLYSCSVSVKDFNIKPTKKGVINTNQNINGAYYYVDSQANLISVIFLYKNSIFRGSHFKLDSKLGVLNSIQNTLLEMKNSKRKYREYFEDGGFSIKERKFTAQTINYIPQFHWGVESLEGEIIDETTIIITRINFPERNFDKKVYKVYKFTELEKPDSSIGNKWINKNWYWLQ